MAVIAPALEEAIHAELYQREMGSARAPLYGCRAEVEKALPEFSIKRVELARGPREVCRYAYVTAIALPVALTVLATGWLLTSLDPRRLHKPRQTAYDFHRWLGWVGTPGLLIAACSGWLGYAVPEPQPQKPLKEYA